MQGENGVQTGILYIIHPRTQRWITECAESMPERLVKHGSLSQVRQDTTALEDATRLVHSLGVGSLDGEHSHSQPSSTVLSPGSRRSWN